MSDGKYLAARETDVLLHTSLLADFVSGVVKGAIYAAAGAIACAAMAVTFPASLLVGAAVGLAVGFVFGEAVDAVADTVASWFPPSEDGLIITGSDNVHTKKLPAARAAGKMKREALLSLIAYDKEHPPKGKAEQIAEGILQKGLTLLKWTTPVGALMSAHEALTADSGAEAEKGGNAPPVNENQAAKPGFWASVGNSIMSPTVASADPNASPADMDKIVCTKWHFNSGGPYLAEGSKRVQINSQPACRKDDRSTCEAKIAPKQEGSKVRIGGDSVVVRDIQSGKNPFMSMLGEIVGGILVGLAAAGRQAIMTCLKSAACDLLIDTAVTAVTTVGSAAVGEALSRATSSNHPIHYARGSKVLAGEAEQDFVLEGQIPLFWQRMYNSHNAHEGVLGAGWSLPFEFSLEIRDQHGEEAIFYIDRSGRELGLGVLLKGMSARYIDEGFTLYRSSYNQFLLQTDFGAFYLFEENPLKTNHFRLHQQLDRHENKLEYHYDPEGRLQQIIDDVQQLQVIFGYDPLLSRLTEAKQVIYRRQEKVEKILVQYHYNERGELIRVSDADGVTTRRYGYDPDHHLMTSHGYATGLMASYRYQLFPALEGEKAHYRVVEHTLWEGEVVLESMQLHYDLLLKQVEVVEVGKGSSYRRWGKNYLISDYVDELDNVWQFTWSEEDKLTQVIDAAGNTWAFEYDLYGNLAHTADPEGQKTHTKWDDDFAYPLVRVMPNGGAWHYQYNSKGDLVLLTDPEGGESSFVYDGAGNRIYQRDAKNNETHYSYNMRGQLQSQTDCSGNVTRFIYDDFGQLSAVQNALQQTEHFTHSPGGKLLERVLADGSTRQYHYDSSGLLSQLGENKEIRAQYRYNARGQITEQKRNGKTLRLEYDNYGRLSTLYNEKGEPYRFSYNVLDEMTQEVRLDGTVRQLSYDRLGFLIKDTVVGSEGGKLQTTLVRDKIGRLSLKERMDYRTEYEYKAKELHIKHIRQEDYQQALSENQKPDYQTLSFLFDAFGQLTEEHNHHGQYRYEYDELGNLLKTAFPDKSELRHFYYGSGHLLQSEFTHGSQQYLLAEYTRDNLHREIGRTQGALTEQTEYDALGRVTAKLSRASTTNHLFRAKVARHYRYDRQSQLQTMKLTLGQGDGFFDYGETQTVDYHYDEAGQILARYTNMEPETFRYDAAGNLLNNTEVAWNNQVERAGNFRYDYDEFGRMRRRANQRNGVEQHFHYDSDNRVTSVEFTRHPRYKRVSYDYDALGRRIAKTLSFTHPCEGEKRTEFYWQGMQLCGEQASNQALTYYFYHNGSYTPLARFDCNDSETADGTESGDLWFMHAEANGMPLLLSDAHGNTVWQQLQADLFGRVKQEKSTLSPYSAKQNLRFAGQYYDEETGLHYNTFRYYAPECGRFTQPDPIGLAGGINLYQYAPNPLGWMDPLGLTPDGVFIHYTDFFGMQNILNSGVIEANVKGKVYITDILMTPQDVMRDVFIGNPRYEGRGDYAIIFKTDPGQAGSIKLSSDLEFVHDGRLKIGEIIHAGKNPYGSLSHLDYEQRLGMTRNQIESRGTC
ncbi:hypothetical protein Z042_07915 [Chania multitudinisentens RB-25]|uniref:Type IV secretion protein Rhs n=1 Tax=Chania multitudinisentens RB-25 TaxID=1441930 RepID=W0LB99_9GAMM|nr:RHS repeat-associated core domain-containing protein [Chania multitudinisentens]AHG19542.1 hypothetical protein Z042_07915 [Chania multitudinisentens RB-25]